MNINGNNQFKKVPIYHNEKTIAYLTTGKSRIKAFLWRWTKIAFYSAIIAGIGISIYAIAPIINPRIVYQEKPVTVEVIAPSPVLDRIAKCESGNNQFDKNNQVLLNYNPKSDSFDIGVMQINIKAWGAKATALGYNLAVEKDNRAMALWIYQNRGTEDWYSSKSCWNK